MPPRTSEETFRRLLELLLAKDMDAIADLWAENCTAEFPFAEGASPKRLTGREAVRGHLAGYPDLMNVRAIPTLTVRHMDQPDTIVVEFTAHGRTVATNEPYQLDYITVLTTHQGLITHYRGYWSPLAAASAAGTLPELLHKSGVPVRVGSRIPPADAPDAVRFDWGDPATHPAALHGMDRVHLVPPVDTADAMPLVEPFSAEAERLGVRRVVLLGSAIVLPGAPSALELAAHVRARPGWVVLRPSGFMQNFLAPHPLGERIRRRGEIRTAAGNRPGGLDRRSRHRGGGRRATDRTRRPPRHPA
ncbi:nuclear transport factor 2 family protein [Streptomyces antimycoticus]